MKHIITKALCFVCAGALALSMAGCSKSGSSSSASSETISINLGTAADHDYQNFTYSDGLDENGYWTGVKALDYVTLPEDFASVSIQRSTVEPTSEDVQSQIDNLLSQHATTQQVTDRAAADGDTVDIDYSGTVDGVAFSGGTYSGYSLKLGSGTFIDGFEDQIVGHTPGETFDVNVTFPDGYSDSTDADGNTLVLSGKKAVFSVTLNSITEEVLPEQRRPPQCGGPAGFLSGAALQLQPSLCHHGLSAGQIHLLGYPPEHRGLSGDPVPELLLHHGQLLWL